jgi:hypothetical protein
MSKKNEPLKIGDDVRLVGKLPSRALRGERQPAKIKKIYGSEASIEWPNGDEGIYEISALQVIN